MAIRNSGFTLAVFLTLLLNSFAVRSYSQQITKDEAIRMVEQYPREPYWQFVVLQAYAREGRYEQATKYLPPQLTNRQRANVRSQSVDLFSIFSGSLAIQESLQLDALVGESSGQPAISDVEITTLVGPTVKSHPWDEMLGNQNPPVSELASYVPEDQLYVRFDSVAKFMQCRSLGRDFGTYVVTQTKQSARNGNLTQKIQKQLALETTDLLMPVYDAVVDEMVITSTDIFFRDGTDVTLLMKLNQPHLIRGQLDGFLDGAAKLPGATTITGQFKGVAFRHVTTPERNVHVFSAFPRPGLLVRSNSRIAFQRILRTIIGDQNAPKPLSGSAEFRYIRTLMPLGDANEDGFVYMSDPFIRQLIGPQKKLTQRRRLICKSHLQLLSHSALLYQTEQGQAARSLEDLVAAKCLGLPEDASQKAAEDIMLACPDGGRYSLSADGRVGVCSHHGTAAHLTPCLEIPLDSVTSDEEKAYNEFVETYSRYWQTFFDPIAVRLQMTPKRYRVETIVLPLINNTVYQSLASVLGGEPLPLDALPVPDRNIFSLNLNFDKQRLMTEYEIPQKTGEPRKVSFEFSLGQVGLALMNYHDAYTRFPPVPVEDEPSGLSWRVHLLPFIGEGELYQAFKLNEPWSSPHNRRLIGRMPEIFNGPSKDLNTAGKTQVVRPFGEQAVYHRRVGGSSIRDVIDGTSNTIMAVIADPDNAVIWTQPTDLVVDWEHPRHGWEQAIESGSSVLLVDCSLVAIPKDISDETLAGLLTRSGGEPRAEFLNQSRRVQRRRSQMPFFDELRLAELLRNGVGSQIGFHVCDADPLIDFNMPRFLGMMAGSFRGGNSLDLFDGEGAIAVLVASLNAPVYLSVPIENAALVDDTLERLDTLLAKYAREPLGDGTFFRIDQDFYHSQQHADLDVRSYAFQFGPLTWRFYWTRIEDGFYVASKPFIIDDLAEATERTNATAKATQYDAPRGHGMVRVRPENWNLTRPHFRIGWAESERAACFGNLGTYSASSRALAHDDHGQDSGALQQLTERVFSISGECPSHGEYVRTESGLACTKHGHPSAPKQPTSTEAGRISELAESLRDVRLELTFLEDGLHATVVIEK